MRYVRLLSVVAMAVVAASCASRSGEYVSDQDGPAEQRQCSDTQKNAVTTFLQGISELSLSLIRKVIPEKSSLWAIFGNDDEERGEEIVRQITTHPEVMGSNRNCTCSLLSMTDTPDPQKKIIVLKRVTFVDDDLRDYKRSFFVHFIAGSNCITSVELIGDKWERM